MTRSLKALFVPSLHYLTDPLYQKIFPLLIETHEIYYVISGEPAFLRANANHIIDVPDFAIPLYSEFGSAHPSGKLLKDLWSLYRYSRPLLKKIKAIKPDVIVYGSDQSPFVKILDRCFPQIPKIVIQTALINYSKGQVKPKERKWFKELLLKILNPIIYPLTFQPSSYGLANPSHYVFLFGEYSYHLLKGKKDESKLLLTGYPLIKKQASAGEGNCILLLLPVGFTDDEERESYEDVEALIHSYPKEEYLLKRHPRANPDTFSEFLKRVDHFRVKELTSGVSPPREIKGVVSFYSFGDMPYLLSHIPLIHHRRARLQVYDYWFDELDVPKSNTVEALIENFTSILERRLNRESIDTYIGKMFCVTGDESARLIVDKILLISKGN